MTKLSICKQVHIRLSDGKLFMYILKSSQFQLNVFHSLLLNVVIIASCTICYCFVGLVTLNSPFAV